MAEQSREYLQASLVRHGEVEGLSAMIERGEKPPYEAFLKFMRGEIDPPIDEQTTRELIERRIAEGKLQRGSFDIIICSPKKRAQQTAELVTEVLGVDVAIHPSKYLREVDIPMEEITPDFYEKAPGIAEVRAKFMDAFLEGQMVTEGIVEVYRRAQVFLKYFRRIKKYTGKTPLFVTHGIFARFLDLAIEHASKQLNDDEIRELVQRQFMKTKRPGTLSGFEIISSKDDKAKIAGLI